MRTKVFWAESEKGKLAERVAEIRNKSSVSLLSGLERAQQELLPPERRRAVQSLAQVPWLSDAVSLRLQLMRAQAAVSGPALPGNAPVVAGGQAQLEEYCGPKAFAVIKRTVLQLLEDRDVRMAVLRMFAMADPEPVEMPGQQAERKEQNRLPRVLVLGLLPAQEQSVLQEFEHYFDLRFARAGAPGSQLRTLARGSTFVFGMTGFIGHQDERQVRAAAGASYMRIEGGLSSLRGALTHTYTTGELPGRGWRAPQPRTAPA